MDLEVRIEIPYLWGESSFQKSKWGSINFLVGPNGSGKSIFAEKLFRILKAQMTTRFFSAERLVGLEKQDYPNISNVMFLHGFNMSRSSRYKQESEERGLIADAFITLKEKLDLQIKIESVLAQLFGRRFRLVVEDGVLKPTLQRIGSQDEYNLAESECHGLKELISLLTFIYDSSINCIIIDEPEMHLHPQYQVFLSQVIRKIAADPLEYPEKKCFFIVTHSPFFIDIKTEEDLKNCLIFHEDSPPSYIDEFNPQDIHRLKPFLPRLNTHHKQFFFATKPIFVEGYTDQQIFSTLQEKREIYLGASGACFIDVGGKDDLEIFFRLCKKLKLEASFVTDFDAIFEGKLRQTIASDKRSKDFLQIEGLDLDLMSTIGDLERILSEFVNLIEKKMIQSSEIPSTLTNIKSAIDKANKIENDNKKLAKKRFIVALAVNLFSEDIEELIQLDDSEDINNMFNFLQGRLQKINEAFRKCNVYVLMNGQIENYYPSFHGNPYSITNEQKINAFRSEYDFILNNEIEQINTRYQDFIAILDKIHTITKISTKRAISNFLGNWIHKVQTGFNRRNVRELISLKTDNQIDLKACKSIFDVEEFTILDENNFKCKIKLKPVVDEDERIVEFDNNELGSKFFIE